MGSPLVPGLEQPFRTPQECDIVFFIRILWSPSVFRWGSEPPSSVTACPHSSSLRWLEPPAIFWREQWVTIHSVY